MTTFQLSPAAIASNVRDRRRPAAVAGAVMATGLLWLVGRALDVSFRVDLHNSKPPQTFGPAFLLGCALLFTLLGCGTLAVLERYTRRAERVWTALALAVLGVSFVPIVAAGAAASTKTLLGLVHLAVAAVLIVKLPSTSRGSRAPNTQ